MTLRRGHGNGAGVPRVEVLPADELPPAVPALTAGAERDDAGRFVKGNTIARNARIRPPATGPMALATSDPRFRRFATWGARYGAHRRRELAAAHGGVLSAGVGTIIESAGQALAASRFLQWLAGQAGDPDLFKAAAQLAQTARQHELAAWELAAREAQARPRSTPHEALAALTPAGGDES